MESKDTDPPKRKVKFIPRAPPRRVPKQEVKTEAVEDDDAVQARDLLRRFNESALNVKPKAEKKVSSSQIAFGYGGSSTSIKSYGNSWGASNSKNSQSSTFRGGAFTPGVTEKEYQEPWDYYSYYPVTLPVRRPYSGNPELLDEEEFGEAAESTTYEENVANPAVELGLLDENLEASMFLLKLPPILPIVKRSVTAEGKAVAGSSKPTRGAQAAVKPCSLEELPSGYMGKMMVYESGAVKLKLGDTLYDVSPGVNCVFAQDVVAMNAAEKHSCTVGEISKHVTITPDVDAILDSVADL